MKTIKLTSEELYEAVWRETLSNLSKKYAYTPDGLKKICGSNNIPLPPSGYWSKLKHNKAPKITILPDDQKAKQNFELIIRKADSQISYDQTPLTILIKEIQNDPKTPFTISETLIKPDILIQNTKTIHGKRKKDHLSF